MWYAVSKHMEKFDKLVESVRGAEETRAALAAETGITRGRLSREDMRIVRDARERWNNDGVSESEDDQMYDLEYEAKWEGRKLTRLQKALIAEEKTFKEELRYIHFKWELLKRMSDRGKDPDLLALMSHDNATQYEQGTYNFLQLAVGTFNSMLSDHTENLEAYDWWEGGNWDRNLTVDDIIKMIDG